MRAKTAKPPDAWVENGKLVVRTIAVLAAATGVSTRTVREWIARGCPGAAGRYVVPDIVAWAKATVWCKADSDDPLLDGGSEGSPALEEYRRVRADIARRELAKLDRQLVPVADLQALLTDGAAVIRKAGESLGRKFGPEAQQILNEAVDAAAALIERLEESDDGSA